MELIGVLILAVLIFIAVSDKKRNDAMKELNDKFNSMRDLLSNIERIFNSKNRQDDKDLPTKETTQNDNDSTSLEEDFPWYKSKPAKQTTITPAAEKLVTCLKKTEEIVETPIGKTELTPEPGILPKTENALPKPPKLPQTTIITKGVIKPAIKEEVTPETTQETEVDPEVLEEAKEFFKSQQEQPSTTEASLNYEPEKNKYDFAKFEPAEREKSEFERKAIDVLKNIWMWIIVGDDFRRKDIAREYAIASTWLVRIAIIILLAGGAFFLKYSIDNNLVPPAVRVLISTVCALGMLGFGIKLIGKDKKYDLLGKGIGGGGIALLYFSVYAAVYMYKLVDTIPGFILMILITATSWAISVRKNVMLFAIFGIVGGYMTPILLSTGNKDLYGLFSYMLLLGVGTLLISRHRDWKLLNWLSYTFTYALFFLALNRDYGMSPEITSYSKTIAQADYIPAMIFSCCYFVLFSCMALTFNIHNKKSATLLELYTLLANTAIFLGTSWIYTEKLYDRTWVACYSLGAAAFFIIHLSWFLRKRFKDRNLTFILFGLSAFCLVLTFPLALSGVWITASWAATAVLFLYLGLRIGSRFLVSSSYLVYFITAFRVVFYDYANMKRGISAGNYWNELTDHLLSSGMLCASFIVGYILMKRFGDDMPRGVVPSSNDLPVSMSPRKTSNLFMWIGVVLGFIFMNMEIPFFAKTFNQMLREPLTALLWGGMLIFMIRMITKHTRDWLGPIVAFFSIILSLKMLFFDLNAWSFKVNLWAYGADFHLMGSLLRTVGFAGVLFALLFGFQK